MVELDTITKIELIDDIDLLSIKTVYDRLVEKKKKQDILKNKRPITNFNPTKIEPEKEIILGKKKKHIGEKKCLNKPDILYDSIASNNISSTLIKKFNLKPVCFDGRRHYGKIYCILLNKILDKFEVFKYMDLISQLNKNAIVSISEENNDFYMIKYKFLKKPKFQSSKKFITKTLDKNFINEIQVFEVEKKKYFMENFKSLSSSVASSVTSEYFGKVLSCSDGLDTKNILEILLRKNYEDLSIKYINEYNCSMMMAMLMFAFSKKNKRREQSSYVYSFEKNMRIDDENRRCDGIYIHKHFLNICEWKTMFIKMKALFCISIIENMLNLLSNISSNLNLTY